MERSILWCRSQHCRNWEEFHQINDHSIELAAVWFHHFMGGRPCPVVPILCGSFQEFVVGDASGFLDLSRSEGDARRMCGLAPIYMALRLLGRTNGEAVGYEQCPADVDGSSLVSIVGVLLYEDA